MSISYLFIYSMPANNIESTSPTTTHFKIFIILSSCINYIFILLLKYASQYLELWSGDSDVQLLHMNTKYWRHE